MTKKNNHESIRRPVQTDCLATVTSSGYIPATLVMIASFLEHNPWFTGDIVIVHDSLPIEDQDLLSCFKNIKFLPVGEALKEKLDSLARDIPERKMKHKFARFFSLEVFRLTGYRKVLFCDSDMLIQDDLSHLFEIPYITESDRLLCCRDRCSYHGGERDVETFNPLFTAEEKRSSKDSFKQTFNSGFMLIDGFYLDGRHYRNMLDLLAPRIWEKIESPLTDQIVLNLYFRDRFHILSGKYNFILLYGNKILEKENLSLDDIKVIHYAGKLKPWNPSRVFRMVIADSTIIRFVRLWNHQYLEFLPHFHLQYQCMNHTLRNRKETKSAPSS